MTGRPGSRDAYTSKKKFKTDFFCTPFTKTWVFVDTFGKQVQLIDFIIACLGLQKASVWSIYKTAEL